MGKQRGPLSPSRLAALRNSVPFHTPARKRPAGAVATEMNTRLRAMGIAIVPADAWSVLCSTFGLKPSWSSARIASHLDVDVNGLNVLMGKITQAIARFDDFLGIDDFLAAVREARESL